MQAIIGGVQWLGSFILNNIGTIGAATSALASGAQAYGQFQQAETERAQAYTVAAQEDVQAKQERAVAQLQAARQRRIAKSQLSEQRTALAASGFSSSDPTALTLVKDTVGAQTLEELLTLAQGEDRARQMEFEAKQTRLGGKNAASNRKTQAMTTLAGQAFDWYDRYGPKKAARAG